MKRSKCDAEAAAVIAEWEAEDRVVNYLAALPEEVGRLTAVKASAQLLAVWEIEKEGMLLRDDPRPVYPTPYEQRCWLASAVAAYSRDALWPSCSTKEVCNLLVDQPPDVAAWLAYRAARHLCRFVRFP